MAKMPKSFRDLSVAELRRSAVEDFAVEADEKDNKDVVIGALTEAGVVWADYVAQHPEVAEEESTETEGKINVRVKEEVVAEDNDKFLIKMVRENPVYEVRGYRFTAEHPYQLVDPAHAQYILSSEDGFRQAFPQELAEFYG